MKKLLTILFLLPLLAVAGTFDCQWIYRDGASNVIALKSVEVETIAPYGVDGSLLITADRIRRTNDSDGSIIISNLFNGRSYRVTLKGPHVNTTITNSFDTNTTGLVNGADALYLGAQIRDGNVTGYSQNSADARFHNVSGDTSTNAIFRGTLKIPDGATSNYVWTATNSNGAGTWLPASAGSGGVTNLVGGAQLATVETNGNNFTVTVSSNAVVTVAQQQMAAGSNAVSAASVSAASGNISALSVVTLTASGGIGGPGTGLTAIPAGQLTGNISDDRLPASISSDITGNAATATTATTAATAASATTANYAVLANTATNVNAPTASISNLNAVYVTGNGSGLTNLYWGITTMYSGDGTNNWPYKVLNSSNAPPELMTRPAQMDGGGESPMQSFGNRWKGISPKGICTYNMYGTGDGTYWMSETNLLRLARIMNTNGMVRNGYNWLLIDDGAGEDTATASYADAFPDGLWRLDAERFPSGFKGLVDQLHALNIKVIIYCSSLPVSPSGSFWLACGSNRVDMVNNVSNMVNYIGVDGFKFEAGFAGLTHFFVNEVAKWKKPIWVNVAADETEAAIFADLVNSWRPGVGVYGDVTSHEKLHGWISLGSFQMTRPGHVNNYDIFQAGNAWAKHWQQSGWDSLVRNSQAIAAMANSEMMLASFPEREFFYQRNWSFYEDYNNPLINAIHADFTKPMWLQSSNHLEVSFGKWRKDESLAVLVMNWSATNKTSTINFKDYFGNYDPSQTLSTNPFVCTVRDVRLNTVLGYYTNSYSELNTPTNNIWVVISKGINEQYSPGTNFLSDFAWHSATNTPNDPGISVNYSYRPELAYGKVTIGGVAYDKSFYINAGYGDIRYQVNRQADFAGFVVQPINGAVTGTVTILTNGVSAKVASLANDAITNLVVPLVGVDYINIVCNKATTGGWNIGNPLIYCPKQTYLDANGYQVFRLDPERPLYGSGVLITNIGEELIRFGSLAADSFSRITPSIQSPATAYFRDGLGGTGASSRVTRISVPGWVTTATFSTFVQCNAVAAWTNLIEPNFTANDGQLVYSGTGLNSSNNHLYISAANAVSNYTFTVTWPQTNVNSKSFEFRFLQASNTAATYYVGPEIKATYR